MADGRAAATTSDRRQVWMLDVFRVTGRLPSLRESAAHLGVSERTIKSDRQELRRNGELARAIVDGVAEKAFHRYNDDHSTAEGKLAVDAAGKALSLVEPAVPEGALVASIRGALGLLGVSVRDDIREALEGGYEAVQDSDA